MYRRIAVAAAALVAGGAVTTALLVHTSGAAPAQEFYVVTHDLPAGAELGAGALRVESGVLGAAAGFAIPTHPALAAGARAARSLTAGALLQRGDVAAPGSPVSTRLVAVPIKDLPPVVAGDRVDLLTVTGAADRADVRLFLAGVEVRAVTPASLVVTVTPAQASALVYALATTRLVAVVSEGGAAAVPAVASLDDAREAAKR